MHAAELRLASQEEEITRLRMELEARPTDPHATVLKMQAEISQLKMIAGKLVYHDLFIS